MASSGNKAACAYGIVRSLAFVGKPQVEKRKKRMKKTRHIFSQSVLSRDSRFYGFARRTKAEI